MFAIFLITTIFAILLANFFRKRSKLPPGPLPLPIIGNLHQIGWLATKHGGIVNALKELKKTYGPVFTLWMGLQPTVHICSMDVAQETMIKRGGEFADRWEPKLFNVIANGLGIILSNGPHWLEQRRFALHTLRNFGLGRGIMEERIMMELDYRTQALDKDLKAGKDEIETSHFFELTVGSIINRMLFGERFEKHQEEEFFTLKHKMDELTGDFSALDCLYEVPVLGSIPMLKKRWDKMIDSQIDMLNFIKKQAVARRQAIMRGDHVIPDEPEDYVDAFLRKMDEESELPHTTYTEESLVANLMDLWSAGQETTTISLLSGFFQLLQNPDVVKKAREEILSVTKGERHLSLKDKANTPYLVAVITEIQRIASIVSINLFRITREDTMVGGHLVAGGTPLTAEVSVLMYEDEHFDHPEKFDPSRYFKNNNLEQHVLPFGMGKRVCPGESLARAELYLITGNLLLRYDIQPPTGGLPPFNENNNSFFKAPPKYNMRLVKL